jgi:hypothetical protein
VNPHAYAERLAWLFDRDELEELREHHSDEHRVRFEVWFYVREQLAKGNALSATTRHHLKQIAAILDAAETRERERRAKRHERTARRVERFQASLSESVAAAHEPLTTHALLEALMFDYDCTLTLEQFKQTYRVQACTKSRRHEFVVDISLGHALRNLYRIFRASPLPLPSEPSG